MAGARRERMVLPAALAGALMGWAAHAETIALTAELSPAAEVPPVDSRGEGSAEVSYDTDTGILTWTITFAGLTSAVSAAHFHGPASPGENGPIVVPLEDLDSPAAGTATLTDEQAGQLLSEQLYLNFHTPAFPGGEIRGQVVLAE